MRTHLTRRGFVSLGAAALGALATEPAFAAKLIHPTSHTASVHTSTTHKALSGRRLKRGKGSYAANRLPEVVEPEIAIPSLPAQPGTRERLVHMVNSHTKETLQAVYWREGRYLPDALHQVNHVMRDHMSGDVHSIDPRLVDLLADLHHSVGTGDPWILISGYRSPRSNAWLHRHSAGVAAHSLHMRGQAADIMLPGEDLGMLHNAALDLGEGGVGYYPRSGFVHVDTGKVREWEYE